MDLDDYNFISYDFRIPDNLLGKGFGKHFVDESFNIFKNKIKGATASWNESPIYPGGSANGYKQFWKTFEETKDKVNAVTETDFYKLMKKKGISKLDNEGITIDPETNSVFIIIYK